MKLCDEEFSILFQRVVNQLKYNCYPTCSGNFFSCCKLPLQSQKSCITNSSSEAMLKSEHSCSDLKPRLEGNLYVVPFYQNPDTTVETDMTVSWALDRIVHALAPLFNLTTADIIEFCNFFSRGVL